MLQIKKQGTVLEVNYCLQFLLRSKALNSEYTLRKKKSFSTFLRSPKHFNIGKQKIINLNYKVINLKYSRQVGIHMHTLNYSTSLFLALARTIQRNTFLMPKSIKLTVSTNFTIMWLEF